MTDKVVRIFLTIAWWLLVALGIAALLDWLIEKVFKK